MAEPNRFTDLASAAAYCTKVRCPFTWITQTRGRWIVAKPTTKPETARMWAFYSTRGDMPRIVGSVSTPDRAGMKAKASAYADRNFGRWDEIREWGTAKRAWARKETAEEVGW